MSSIEPIKPVALKSRLSSAEPPLILDVREYPEYAGGHLHGAVHFPLGEIEKRSHELPKDRQIITVCRSGRRSEEAAAKLFRMGFGVAGHLEGGTTAWVAEGLPVDKEARAPWALERQVRLVAGLLVLLGLGLSHLWAPAIVLAWFVPLGLVFAALTDSCAMGSMLAKMPWNRRTSSAGPVQTGTPA